MIRKYCIRPKGSLYTHISCVVILSERLYIRRKSVKTGRILDTLDKRKHL